jgi:Mg-chelatase subunit ChlD
MNAGNEEKILRAGGHSSLPHRIQLPSYADVKGKREQLIDDILNQVLEGEKAEEMIAFSTEDMLALVEEITREEKFRRPLKYGAFDLLLKRVQRSPESKLAQLVEEMRRRLEELYSEQLTTTSLTGELLIEIEEARKRDERMAKLREEVEAKALGEALSYLEQQRILERGSFGWELSKRGVSFLLQRLTPQLMTSSTYGYGKHSTGRRLSIGEGREVGTRHYRFGDKYRDVSIKDTLREAIRNRRQMATKDDIMVTVKDIRAKMDIVLVVDLSGTMYQLEKLWQAKESAIALSIAAAQYGDRVGVVSFSNLADVVVDITGSPHRLTKRIIDLELHHNAFTNIGYGILKATQLFAHRRCGRANQHMIIISDGDATAPHPSPQRYALKHATRAARKGITISCVCLNEESTNPELMQKIAKIGKGRIYFVAPESITSALLEEQAVAKFS